MRKRRIYIILVAVGVLAVLLLVVFIPSAEREPVYGGRPLSEWLELGPSNFAKDGGGEAEQAIRHIGTNAIPYLLRWIAYEPPRWKVTLYEVAGRVFKGAPNRLFQYREVLRAAGAVQAFGILGPQADSARRELIRLQNDPNGRLSRVHASMALQFQEARGKLRADNISIAVNGGTVGYSLTYRTNGPPIITVSNQAAVANPTLSAPAKKVIDATGKVAAKATNASVGND